MPVGLKRLGLALQNQPVGTAASHAVCLLHALERPLLGHSIALEATLACLVPEGLQESGMGVLWHARALKVGWVHLRLPGQSSQWGPGRARNTCWLFSPQPGFGVHWGVQLP